MDVGFLIVNVSSPDDGLFGTYAEIIPTSALPTIRELYVVVPIEMGEYGHIYM